MRNATDSVSARRWLEFSRISLTGISSSIPALSSLPHPATTRRIVTSTLSIRMRWRWDTFTFQYRRNGPAFLPGCSVLNGSTDSLYPCYEFVTPSRKIQSGKSVARGFCVQGEYVEFTDA